MSSLTNILPAPKRSGKSLGSRQGLDGTAGTSLALTRRPAADQVAVVDPLEVPLRPSLRESPPSPQAASLLLPGEASKEAEPQTQFIRYTPGSNGAGVGHNSGAGQRVIKVQTAQVDPMEPPRFKAKKYERPPPSPPVPVLHSPERKLKPEELADWKIPAAISSWKNPHAYVVPLHQRVAADGRNLREVKVNDKFAELSEALYHAERNAREEIELRARMQREAAKREKANKEEELKELAKRAREMASRREEVDERDEFRREREREIRREIRLDAAHKTKTGRDRAHERDIGEKIALGQLPSAAESGGGGFDERLFDRDEGLAPGAKADDTYTAYDKPLFSAGAGNYVYRSARANALAVGEGSGPVQFEKEKGKEEEKKAEGEDRPGEDDGGEEEDPFGLGEFLSEARRGKQAENKSAAMDARVGKMGYMQAAAGSELLQSHREGGRVTGFGGGTRRRRAEIAFVEGDDLGGGNAPDDRKKRRRA